QRGTVRAGRALRNVAGRRPAAADLALGAADAAAVSGVAARVPDAARRGLGADLGRGVVRDAAASRTVRARRASREIALLAALDAAGPAPRVRSGAVAAATVAARRVAVVAELATLDHPVPAGLREVRDRRRREALIEHGLEAALQLLRAQCPHHG